MSNQAAQQSTSFIPLVYLCTSEQVLARGWGRGLVPWLGCETQLDGGSLASQSLRLQAQWSNRKSGQDDV